MEPDPIKNIEALTKNLNDFIEAKGKNVFTRYPLTFSLLGTFGVVFIIHGIEKIIEKIPFLHNQPVLVLAIGIFILIFTGNLYRRISQKLH